VYHNDPCFDSKNIRDVKNWFHRYNKSIIVIPNPVLIPTKCLATDPEIALSSSKRFVAMGRLVYQKGFEN